MRQIYHAYLCAYRCFIEFVFLISIVNEGAVLCCISHTKVQQVSMIIDIENFIQIFLNVTILLGADV